MSIFKKLSVFIMVMGMLLCQLSVFAQNGSVITATPSGPVCIGDQVNLSVSCPDDGTRILSEGFSDITSDPHRGVNLTGLHENDIYVYLCPGGSYIFPGPEFNGQNLTPGEYSVTLSGAASDGSDSIIHLHIIQIDNPSVSIIATPNVTTICNGQSVTLSAQSECVENTILVEDFSCLASVCDTCDDQCNTYDVIGCQHSAPGGGIYELSQSTYSSVLPNFPLRTNAYPAGDAIKLGKGMTGNSSAIAATGGITSRELDLSQPFFITISSKGWGTFRGKIVVSVDGSNEQSFITSNDPWPGTYTDHTLFFPAATNHSTITIRTDTILPSSGNITEGYRAFIDHIVIQQECHYLWSTGESGSSITISPTDNSNYTVSVSNSYGCQSDASYSLTVTDCENDNCEKWFRVNNINQLSVGDKLIIATHNLSEGHYHAMAQQHPDGAQYMDACQVVKQDTLLTNIEHAQKFTLTSTNPYVFQNESGNYLSYPGTGNTLTEINATSANSNWNVTIGNDQIADIRNQAYSNYSIQYNASAHRFSCYASNQQPVELYKLNYIHPFTISFNPGDGACTVTELTESDCQTGIILPTAVSCAPEYIFSGWTTHAISTPITTAPNPLHPAGLQYYPTADQTLYAVYKKCDSSELAFLKVTSDTNNWVGDYLIVYEDGNLAFNGGLTTLDGANNTIPVTISNNIIAYNQATNDARFTIASGNNSWTIKSASNYYIGQTNDANGLSSNQNTPYSNSINFSNGSINIISSGGAYLRFNSAANQNRFRYYKSNTYTNQNAIQLFKYELIEECEYTTFPFFPSEIENEIACSSFTWTNGDGQTYTESGTYYHAYDDVNGCHHVDTLYLTVGHSNTGDTTAFACDRFDWYEHTNITSSTDALTHTFTNASGCDSVVTLHLTVGHSNTGDTTAIACDRFDWYEHTNITSSTDALTHTFTNASGCDSVVTLHLTINHSSTGDTTATACDHFDWYEHANITASCDNLTHTFTNASGCDSVVTLHLTVNHDTTVVITKDTCDWYQWHNTIYRQSGRYEWHGETAQGCDSTEVLWLTIRKSTYGILNAEVCEDDLPLVLYGQTFTESVMSNAVISNAAGCDSLILINVTVKYNTYSDLYDTIVENSLPYDTLGMHFTETGTQTDTISNVAGCDSIVTFHLQVWPNAPVTELDTVVCEGALPLVWHDSLFTVAGQKTVTLHTQHGADSVVTMHLTVNPMYDIQETAIVSQGDLPYVWHGRAFSADTTVCDTLRTQAGCDSVVCLDLTVTSYNVEYTAITLCQGETYIWHNQILSEARSYRDTVPEENTIYIATVTINPTYSVTDPVIVPQGDLPYLWHGRAFSADTTVCDTLHTQAGCDSVVCLDLTVTAYNVEDTAIALCPGETYPWHGQILSEARSYRDTVPEENTIYIATMTINPTYSVTDPVIVPQGQLPYVWHGREFSVDTTVCDTLRTQAGCDSVVCLDLTVTAYHVEDTAIALCPGETYPWHGQTLSEARSYRDTVPGENTIYIASVTINPTYSVTNPVVVPQGQLPYVWHGREFSADTTVCDTLRTQAGCDSVVCLDLTVTAYNVEDTAIALCPGETYPWHGQTLSEARSYRDTVPEENTIYIATVTINPTYSVTSPVIVPQGDLPYVWHGRAFSADTTVCDTLRTEAGCDSVVCLDLTVTAYNVEDTAIALCPGETYLWHGQTLSEARSYRDTVPEENTIYIATVTINPIYSVTDPVIVPQGDLPYVWHGREFSADTTVCDTLRTEAGCDSVVCLDLTVTAYHVEDTTIALCPGETYLWHGQTLSEARSYRDTVPEENTIYIATVTISPTYSVTDPVIIPQGQLPYLWHGRAFSADTTVCDTLRTEAGCDSVVCLDLAVTAYNVEDTAIALCPGETYLWHDQILSEARSYRDTIPGENTIFIATVTINPTYSVTDPVIVPQGQLPYVWHGRAFSADTTVCDTLRTEAGCDSVVCLDLTVTAYNVEDTAIALCPGETYTWHGQTLSEARSYRDTVPEENTIYIATVTINPTYSVTSSVIVPQGDLPYVWHGRAFSADTTVCDTLRTQAGCDSVVCLDLTVTAYNVEDTAIALCPGETYPWHGQTLSEARSYRDTVPEENTIFIATVTINPTYSVTDPVIVPQGQLPYVWHGRAFSADTTVCDTLHTQAGCDSVVCLDLTVTSYNVEYTAITLCQGETYTWHGQTLSEARSYRDTVPEENTIYIATVTVNPTYAVETFLAICENQLPYHYVNGQIDTTFDVGTPPLSSQNFQLSTITGCDSIVTLHLTVSSPTVSDIIVSSCGSFVWHGRTFTESTDTATFRTTNAAGCDIILTLHLTVNPLDSTDLYESICAGDTYDFNGRLISQEGIYRDTIHRQEACDSIVILHLSVLNPSHQSYTIERCGSYTWENGDGQTYTESGQYYYRHENSDGCMQVDTLFLTIHPLPATPILSITPNTGCTEYNGIITVTAPVGGYLYDFDGGGFQSSNTFANLNAGEYIVSVRDVSHGCVSTTTALVTTVGNTLAVEVSGTSPCEGEDMQLFAETQSGGVTYLWSGPDNFTSTLQNPIVGNASPANAGVYTVLVTEMATGCVASGSLTVAVNPLPVVTVSGDAMIMIGHSATLTAMGADSYLWSNGAATPVVTVSPQEMTTYTVTGTNTFGCNDTASFEVVVIYDCFLPAQNGEEYVHCVSQVVPPQLPEVIACGDTIPLVAGENMGNVESGCGDSVFVYHYTFRDTQYTWTYTYHVSPDAMPLLNNRSIIISCLSDTVKPTPPVMVNSCLDTIVPIEMPVEVEVTGCSGVVRYVWKYEDCAGHQQNWTFSYIIRDNIAPTFSQPGDVAICRNANGTYDADTTITGLPVSLNDNCADTDDLSVSYNDLFVDNQNMADTLFRTWVVTDPCGNVARAVQKIIVYDTYHTEIHEGICGRDLPYTFNVGGRDTIISAVSSYSSTFNFPLISQNGCDSLVTLHLTVDTVAEIQEQLSICENELPYHFTYGQIDTIFDEGTPAFATYRFLIPAQGGCESIVWLALTVTPSYNVDIYETACDMYIWHNTPYRQSGSYEWHGQTVNGCDSVETLRLTIHRSSMSVQDSTVCDNDLPFVWNGVTFNEAGNGSAVLAGANAEHCDSVVLMMLHVNRTDTTVLYDTIVENQLPYYYTNGQIDTTFAAGTAQSSTFRFLLQNVSGCDSTVTLYLTMNMNVTAQADSTVCENDLPLQWNGITFTGAGTDSVVLAASNGADSLLVMHVYVNPNTSAALYDTIVENQLPYHYTNGQIDTVFAVGTPHFTTSRFMLSNANGCDSAVTLKLTVILNVSVELDSAVCPSALPLIWNGVEFSDAGTDTAVVPASTGSDSVIVMHLTLLPVQLTNLHVEVCASDFPYHFVNGQIDTVIASLATHHAVFNFLFSTQDGCDSIVRLNLSVLDTSLSVVSLSDYCDNMSTTLSALSSMENFVWSTGEISQDIEVTAPGVYSVTASTGDCQSMSSYVVDACELVLYLPNAISPGKLDGHNDCFSLPERYIGLIDEFEITIVNRWGEVVFHSNDKNFKWYGDYKGSVVRQNVYNYIIHYTELDPKKGRHHLKGALIVL